MHYSQTVSPPIVLPITCACWVNYWDERMHWSANISLGAAFQVGVQHSSKIFQKELGIKTFQRQTNEWSENLSHLLRLVNKAFAAIGFEKFTYLFLGTHT